MSLVSQVLANTPGHVGAQHTRLVGIHRRRNQQLLRTDGGIVLPGEAAPDKELLVGAEILIPTYIELIAVLAGILVDVVVRVLAIDIGVYVSMVRIGKKLSSFVAMGLMILTGRTFP